MATDAFQMVVDSTAYDALRPNQIANVTHQTNKWWRSMTPSPAFVASRHRRFRGQGSIETPSPNNGDINEGVNKQQQTAAGQHNQQTANLPHTCAGVPTAAPVVVVGRRPFLLCFEVDSQWLPLRYVSF